MKVEVEQGAFSLETVSGTQPPLSNDPYLLSGYHEPVDNESSLTFVLDSYLPFIQDHDSTVKLLVFLGKSILNPSSVTGEAITSG